MEYLEAALTVVALVVLMLLARRATKQTVRMPEPPANRPDSPVRVRTKVAVPPHLQMSPKAPDQDPETSSPVSQTPAPERTGSFPEMPSSDELHAVLKAVAAGRDAVATVHLAANDSLTFWSATDASPTGIWAYRCRTRGSSSAYTVLCRGDARASMRPRAVRRGEPVPDDVVLDIEQACAVVRSLFRGEALPAGVHPQPLKNGDEHAMWAAFIALQLPLPQRDPAVLFRPYLVAGASGQAIRVGGPPLLPTGTAWPTVDGSPMVFLGQIDFASLAPLDPDGVLPDGGGLAFFAWFPPPTTPYGVDYTDLYLSGHFTVVPIPAGASLSRCAVPPALPEVFRLTGWEADAKRVWGWLAPGCVDHAALGWTQAHRESYAAFWEKWMEGADAPVVLGVPHPVQCDVRLEWEDAPVASTIVANVRNPERWVNLLSFCLQDLEQDGERPLGLSWAYIGIPEDALEKGDYSKVQIVLQNT